MNSGGLLVACGIGVVACGLAAGVFLTFSDFLMPSLRAVTPASGIQAMQMINRKVYRSGFVVLLWGLVVAAPLLILFAYLSDVGAAFGWIVAAGGIYWVGAFAVTLAFNVPMNEQLDAMDDSASETMAYWESTYLPTWTFWNSVRTLMTMTAGICYGVAVVLLAQAG